MSTKAIVSLLKESEFFGGLSASTLETIAGLCVTQTLKKDSILFTEGSPGEKIFLLSSGLIQLFKETANGKISIIHLVHPGDLFAEVVLFEQETYPVTAITLQKTVVVAIPRKRFLDLLEERKAREEFLKVLMGKLRLLTRHIRRLTTDDLEERFVGFLKDHFDVKKVIRPEMSKKDMASAMGVTPEAFSRFLTRMKKSGRLSWEKGLLRLY